MNNKPMSIEAKRKISLAMKGKKKRTELCDLCGESISVTHISRHRAVCGGIGKQAKRRAARDHQCPHCGIVLHGKTYGSHVVWCKKNPGREQSVLRVSQASIGRLHSDATKKRISEKRKEFLNNNPDMVPYRLNHHSKGMSYPERYFNIILKRHDVQAKYDCAVSRYSLDFAIVDKMIDLEIDGEQHYVDKRIVESDIRRTRFLESKGWKVLRIRWSSYVRMPKSDREQFIKDLIAGIVQR